MSKTRAVKTLPKEVWIGWISSMVEAYNMAIYSFTAPLLAHLLFQHTASWSAIFFSYSLVLIGSCFLYPAGALYYGLIGDQRGRQKLCIYSTLGLALATGMMGLIPFHSLDNVAWICFLVLICGQYFFSGGEYHGSIVFSLEHAEQKQSGLMSSLSCLFAVFGIISANGLATLAFLMQDELWIRICFFVGAGGGLISYLLKNHCQETPAFIGLSQDVLKEVNWTAFVKLEWRKICTLVTVLAFYFVTYTFIFIFLPLIHFENNAQAFDTFKSLFAYGFFLVLSGLLADRIGIQKVILSGICLFSLAVIPLTYFCKDLFVLQMVLTPCVCLTIGPIHSWMLHQFNVEHRCRGIFISSAIATSIFGGSTVPICLMIFEYSHSLALCSIYPLMIGLISFGSLISMSSYKQKVLA